MDNDWPIPAAPPPAAAPPPEDAPPPGNVPAGARCGTHPERIASYTCERCGNFLCFECTRLTETGDVFCPSCEHKSPATIPWERRQELGIPRAFLQTLHESLAAPATFFARAPREERLFPTLVYGFVFSFVSTVIGSVHQLLLGSDEIQQSLSQTPELAAFAWLGSPWVAIGSVVLSPLIFLINIYFWAALWWLSLKVLGAVTRPFERIVRALCYVNPVTLLGALQIFGDIVGALGSLVMLFWIAALTVVAMWKVQDIELWRAVVAAALIVVMLFSVCCGFVIFLSAVIAAAMP